LGVIADLPVLDRDEGFVKLEKLSLVNKNKDRFSFLPVTRVFAAAKLEKDNARYLRFGRRWVDYLKQQYITPIMGPTTTTASSWANTPRPPMGRACSRPLSGLTSMSHLRTSLY